MKKFISILLALVLTVGLLVPTGAQAASDPPFYVLPTLPTTYTSVVKGDVGYLTFFLTNSFSGSLSHNLMVVEIYKGDMESFFEDEDPVLVETREYSCDKFSSSRELTMSWKADSRYRAGTYSMICYLVSDTGTFYEQYINISELHVLDKAAPATDMELALVDYNNDYEYISEFPSQINFQQTYTMGAILLPIVNTSDKSYKITNYDPSCLEFTQTGFHGFTQIRGKKVGSFSFTVEAGSIKKTYQVNCVMNGLRIVMTPGKAPLCPGQTDQVQVAYWRNSESIRPEFFVPVWSSSNPKVATVDNGVITAVAPGTTTITVKVGDTTQSIVYTVAHEFSEVSTEVAPTATQPGYQEGECKNCGAKNARNIIPAIFTDTVATAWYAPHVDFVYENAIMNGVNKSTFGTNQSMNRAMVATVLYRAAGSPEVEGEMPFSDIREGSYYEKAVLWAVQNGIVTGYADGTFLPTREITREQLATILYRYTNSLGVVMSEGAELNAFPDEGSTANYAREALSWAVGEGLVTGVKTDGVTYLRPKNTATRAQFATIISRYMATEWEPLPEPV